MKELWFRRKRYGWGWTPSTWQGWSIVGVYFVLVVVLLVATDVSNKKEMNLFFLLPFLILTTTLIIISYKKGEKPQWQWRKDSTNK